MTELEQQVTTLTQELKFLESLVESLLGVVHSMAWGSSIDRDNVQFLTKELQTNIPGIRSLRNRR